MYTYNTQPTQRVKRVVTTVTRTFDENENLVEERTETETEYEYVATFTHTNNPWSTTGVGVAYNTFTK
jgi:hypothetical protein